jgi:hypothetical protein
MNLFTGTVFAYEWTPDERTDLEGIDVVIKADRSPLPVPIEFNTTPIEILSKIREPTLT